MSFQDYQGILGLLGGVIGVCVAVATYFRGVIQQNQKIHTMELEMNTIQTRFNVFWAVIEKELPKVLIRPHQPEIDAYLRRMKDGECLTVDEKREMVRMMRQVIDNPDKDQDDNMLISGYIWLLARFESELSIVKQDPEVGLTQDLQAQREKNTKRRLRFW